jgi:hypothetical protein
VAPPVSAAFDARQVVEERRVSVYWNPLERRHLSVEEVALHVVEQIAKLVEVGAPLGRWIPLIRLLRGHPS